MIIKYPALNLSLQKKIHPIYVLIGNDPYLLNNAADQIKQTYRDQNEYSQTLIDIQSPQDWSLLMAEANSYDLFSEQVLLDARFDKKSIDATGKSLLTDYLTSVNEKCLIILRAPLLSVKSISWLTDSPNTVVVQISPFAAPALKQWIISQLQSQGLQIDAQVVDIIQQSTQGNMLATAQLIDKLALCYRASNASPVKLTLENIREHLSDQSHFELYDLTDACLNANASLSLRLLRQFRFEKIEPTLILWILTQEIRLLIQLHYLIKQPMNLETACQQLKIWTSRVKFYSKSCARLSLQTLFNLLKECQHVDDMIKTSQSMQLWDKFDRIALTLCGQKTVHEHEG